MKKLMYIIGLGLSLLTFTVAQGQTNVTYNEPTGNYEKFKSQDSIKPQSKPDIIINMEMIESFRRCYDKIETIDWASLLRGVTADEVGMIYMAYCRLQTLHNTTMDTQTLIAEKDKIKNEVNSETSIQVNSEGNKNLYTTASLVNSQNISITK